MQPLRLTIFGDVWDSYLYRGRLYLWDMSSALHVFDWDALVDDLTSGPNLALTCAFARSDLLYRSRALQPLFSDPLIKEVVGRRFEDAAARPVERSLGDLARYLISTQDNPVRDQPTDISIYRSVLYQLTRDGISAANVHRPGLKHGVATRVRKCSDIQGVSIEAAHHVLAVAAASEGFFEISIRNSTERRLGSRYTTFVRWLYASVFGGSDLDGGELAAFSWRPTLRDGGSAHLARTFEKTFSAEDIARRAHVAGNSLRFSWGSRDKIYLMTDNALLAIAFRQEDSSRHMASPSPSFKAIGTLPVPISASPIDATSASFGVVLEYRDQVVTILSDESVYSFAGPVVRWRTFPRSIRYENQLHLIYEDRLVIESFNQDYLVDQEAKVAGTKVKPRDFFREDA